MKYLYLNLYSILFLTICLLTTSCGSVFVDNHKDYKVDYDINNIVIKDINLSEQEKSMKIMQRELLKIDKTLRYTNTNILKNIVVKPVQKMNFDDIINKELAK